MVWMGGGPVRRRYARYQFEGLQPEKRDRRIGTSDQRKRDNDGTLDAYRLRHAPAHDDDQRSGLLQDSLGQRQTFGLHAATAGGPYDHRRGVLRTVGRRSL